jgi:hypothetical protein
VRQEGVIGLRTTAQRARACALLSNERRVPGRSHGRHSGLSTRQVLFACSPFSSAMHASGLPWYIRYQLGEEGQSRQVISGLVVIFTQLKSGHVFACWENIISASPVITGLLLVMSSLRYIIEHIAILLSGHSRGTGAQNAASMLGRSIPSPKRALNELCPSPPYGGPYGTPCFRRKSTVWLMA